MALGVCDKGLQRPPYVGVCHGLIVLTQVSGNVWWCVKSVDEELGLVFLPTGTPSNDWYGGMRPGNNLFAESIVAVDIETGQRVWHFQTVHHPIWNYDLPNVPILADVTVDGQDVPMVIQTTKSTASGRKQRWKGLKCCRRSLKPPKPLPPIPS